MGPTNFSMLSYWASLRSLRSVHFPGMQLRPGSTVVGSRIGREQIERKHRYPALFSSDSALPGTDETISDIAAKNHHRDCICI